MSTDRYRELLEELLSRKQAEEDFYTFVKQAWPYVEGGKTFVGGWAIQATAEHLEELYYGRIKRLLINEPPRMTKSTLVSVLWPVWVWIKNSSTQIFSLSYVERLAMRDNVKARRLIKSKWFQDRWGDRFSLALDQDAKDRIDNMQGGYRVVAGLDGSITGDGGDIVICFPPDEMVWTEFGLIRIGDIVERKLNIKVWSFNSNSRKPELKLISGWHKNPSSPIVEIGFSDGAVVRCTPNHKIWTLNRGFVPAVWLESGDVCPLPPIFYSIYNAYAHLKSFCYFSLFSCGFKNFHSSFCRYFRHMVFFTKHSIAFFRNILGVFSPILSCPNTGDGIASYPIFPSKYVSKLIASNYFSNLLNRQFSAKPSFWDYPMSFGIGKILGSASITKIFKRVVRFVPIQMPYIIFKWSRPNKGQHYSNMNRKTFFYPIQRCSEKIISVGILSRFHNGWSNSAKIISSFSPRSVGTNSPHIRDAIKSFITRKRSPVFLNFSSHVNSTYCLSVEDNHNFYCGVGQVLVSNCDDPNNVRDQSESTLENALNIFTEVIPTRFNDFKTGRMVVVQQRCNERDISGWILSNQKKEWTHLCLPMQFEEERRCTTIPLKSTNGQKWVDPRKEEGELLCPDRIGDKELKLLKSALGSEMAIAGQLQQRPAPAEGGMIKRAWFQPWKDDSPPAIRFIIQAWDTAMSTKKGTSYSACTTWGIFKDDHGHDSLILLAAWRKRVEFPDLYKAVQRMARDYRATTEDREINERYKPDLVLVEEKASGVQLIQTLNKTGLVLVGWRPDKYGDKVERVRRVTHLLESGRVYVPYRGPDFTKPKQYADFLISQCATFPAGDGADLVDTFTSVLQRCINSGWLLHSLEHGAMQQAEWNREYKQQEQQALY